MGVYFWVLYTGYGVPNSVFFLSKCTPRCFVVFEVGIIILFNVIGGQIPCLSVKVICHDFVSLILILTFQFLYQGSSSWRWDWRCSEAARGFSWTIKWIAMSVLGSVWKPVYWYFWTYWIFFLDWGRAG